MPAGETADAVVGKGRTPIGREIADTPAEEPTPDGMDVAATETVPGKQMEGEAG